MLQNSVINIDDTRFIYGTNFAGDPDRDRFGDIRRKAIIVIPDPAMAQQLRADGVNVRETRPHPDQDPAEFVPESFVPIYLKYNKRDGSPVRYLPKVYLVQDNGDIEPLTEETVAILDNIRVKNVNVSCALREYDPITHRKNLYIRTLYVEQSIDDDPYAARYAARREAFAEESPF